MRAVHFNGTAARLEELAEPTLGDETVIVRVTKAGICRTDLELTRGYMDFRGILGHEFVGQVCEGPVEWRGQRVVGEINFACGACSLCQVGLPRHCPSRQVMGIAGADGTFAEFVRVPIANLHSVPPSVSDDAAVFCEPLAAAFEILSQIDIAPGVECTVLGDGKLGLLVAQVLQSAGARVLAVGHHAGKLAILAKRDIETRLAGDWDGAPRPLVVEATGSAEGFARAVAATLPRGTVVLKSTVAERGEVDLSPLVIDEIKVVGDSPARWTSTTTATRPPKRYWAGPTAALC